MHHIRGLMLVLLCAGLVLVAAPALAAGPDLLMTVGPVVKVAGPDGAVWKVEVTIRNAGTVKPPVATNAWLRVSGPSGQVCEAGVPTISETSLPPNASLKAFAFEVKYPHAPGVVRPGVNLPLKGAKPVAYTFSGEVNSIGHDCQGQLQDTNCSNNSVNTTRQFAAGGTPSCRSLLPQ